jgi:tRNA1Val (adenine37-N6)-methyltransferase
MSNTYFRFKAFTIQQERAAMKVTTDGCLFGAWVAARLAGAAGGRALDIGTGTGLLTLMVMQQCGLQVDAVEIDAAAAEQARENIAAAQRQEDVRIVEVDILNHHPPQPYRYIFSNPPFYENELKSGREARDTAHHSLALGLGALLEYIREHLEEEGAFFLLFPFKRREVLIAELRKAGLFSHEIVTVSPSVTHPPFRLLLKGGKHPAPCIESSLAIRDAEGMYTEAFTALLRPYYLNL